MNTWVTDPCNPCYSINTRRIVLGKDTSIIITIDMKNPYQLCEIAIMAPTETRCQLLNALQQSKHQWSVNYIW